LPRRSRWIGRFVPVGVVAAVTLPRSLGRHFYFQFRRLRHRWLLRDRSSGSSNPQQAVPKRTPHTSALLVSILMPPEPIVSRAAGSSTAADRNQEPRFEIGTILSGEEYGVDLDAVDR
jgi:hypothetical protein